MSHIIQFAAVIIFIRCWSRFDELALWFLERANLTKLLELSQLSIIRQEREQSLINLAYEA